MSPLDWFKKERPLRGLAGLGGGFAGRATGVSPGSSTGGTETESGG